MNKMTRSCILFSTTIRSILTVSQMVKREDVWICILCVVLCYAVYCVIIEKGNGLSSRH